MTIGTKKNKQAIIWRIEGITSPHPNLTMLINVNNLDSAYSQIVTETRTLGGFSQEFWGEQLTSISASGRTGMFYGDKGITNKDMRNSESYQNFLRLINIYKNNAKEYSENPDSVALRSNPNKIISIGRIIMTYMEKEYEGYFDNFSIKETGQAPFYLEYDFSFKVIRTIGDFIVEGSTFIKAQK